MAHDRATRHDWHTDPMPAARRRLPFSQVFTASESERVRMGFVPFVMEDKWFVFLEGDRLYFHRSWTGICYFESVVEDRDGLISIKEVWMNADSSQVGWSDGDTAESVRRLHLVIDSLFREPPAEHGRAGCPSPSGRAADTLRQ